MHRRMVVIALMALGLGWGLPAQADLFDTARRVVRTDLGQRDTSGVTLRGGASLSAGLSPQTTTLLRGQAQVGGLCGSFDFGASLKQSFEELPDVFEGLLGVAVSNLPMLVLCYASPTLCDLAKHWQALVNLALQHRYAQCQSVQNAMAYGGLRLRGGQIGQCLADQVHSGTTVSEALKTCNGSVESFRTPSGGRADRVELVQETLTAAGVSAETQALARGLLGEVTLRATGGQLGSQQDRTPAAMLQRYEGHRQTAETALRQALEHYRTTGTVSDALLREVSVPGQPLPRAALEALATLQQDPVRADSLLQKVTTGLALTRLTWECHELQEQLAVSIEANHELTDEQRRLLEKRLDGLQRDLSQVTAKKEVLERHLQPALDALLREHALVQEQATQLGMRAPSPVPAPAPFRRQQPAGYGH